METDKPLISILLAVYEPRMDWLREQLMSLEAQTYPNKRLYIRDDGSSPVTFSAVEACVSECIRSFPYTLTRNQMNLGSNLTFEQLTREAEGAYFAYCDQDDVWLPEKLEILQRTIEKTGALLTCSDMYIIDENGRQRADSITKVRRNHVFHSGKGLAPKLVFHNWVTGCAMLVRSADAKSAVPFCPYMVHDQYIALFCAARGRIECITERLLCYRIHGDNQTGIMAGVNSRACYLEVRVREVGRRLEWLQMHFPNTNDQLWRCLEVGLEWIRARESNLQHRGGALVVWKYRQYGPKAALFELFAPWLPEKLFLFIVALARKNRI